MSTEADQHLVTEHRLDAIRAMCDWEAVADDLARLPVVWDEQVARVLGRDGDNGYRGATDDEIDRIVQVVTAHLHTPLCDHAPAAAGGAPGPGEEET